MADDVVALVQALGLTKPLICGYSDGGETALEIGMRYPNLAAALVVGAVWYRSSAGLAGSANTTGRHGSCIHSRFIWTIEEWASEPHFRDFEAQVRQAGATTVWLGTDDEDGRTSLGGVDLYPDVLERAAAIRNLHSHPFEYYLKLGYSLVGIIPDANGPGKPDILVAKRVQT